MSRRDEDPYELALRALSYKERTEAELRGWLADRGVEGAECEEVLARLAEAGAVDDARFARRYAEDKRELAGWGPERIRRSLDGRGVAREHVEEALAGYGHDEQLRQAVSLLHRRELRCDSDAERDRALRVLVARGFSLELGYDAVRAVERGSAEAA